MQGTSIEAATQPLPIATLVPTQENLRGDVDYCLNLAQFVRGGGVFTIEALNKHARDLCEKINVEIPPQKLVTIAKFLGDKRYYIWDGHHRIIAIYLGGRSSLLSAEYNIMNITFHLATEVNFKKGYVTPFDPRKEIRVSDFGMFKEEVHNMLYIQKKSEEEVRKFIFLSRERYSAKRVIHTVQELAECIMAEKSGTDWMVSPKL